MKNDVVIVGACRTPIGSFLGSLQDVHVKELGRIVGTEALRRAGIGLEDIDEIVCGNVIQAGCGGNVARQVQGAIGIPWRAGALTVNQLCASGMRALEIAAANIMLGKTSVALVLGVENMSLAPYLIPKGRTGYRMGSGTIEDAMLLDALECSIEHCHMGMTAENIAERYEISREEQDALACESQSRAARAISAGRFRDEIVPVAVKRKKETVMFDIDEHVRPATNMEALAALKPVFRKKGTVTAGNASGVNDGAAAVVLMSRQRSKQQSLHPLAVLRSTCTAGIEPEVMGLGPARAIPGALLAAGLTFMDIDYFELNEAFAAQYLGVERMLQQECGFQFDRQKVNRNGSGIALGHPVGCSGLRVVVSLVHEMMKTGEARGCASLCAGGGPAMAAIIERI
ncbi:MAG: thiolase family protein [Deltaproteobacteria bacterium]|nr:thiolase family protein [Deltaproteobacteria bacterium]